MGAKNNNRRMRNIIFAGIVLAIIVALALVFALPRPLSKVLFPHADELNLDSISLRVISPLNPAEGGDNPTIISEHEKLGDLEKFISETEITFNGRFRSITLGNAAYRVYLNVMKPNSIPPREDRSFTVVEGDDTLYVYDGASGGNKYKIKTADLNRLISILQPLAQNDR